MPAARRAELNFRGRAAERSDVTRLSRPYQIALVAVAVLAAAWFALLRSHGPAQSPSGSTSAASAQTHAKSNGQGGLQHVYNGPAPGLHGLSEAVKKAHETAGRSERERHASEAASAEASGSTTAAAGAGSSSAQTSAPSHSSSSAAAATGSHRRAARHPASAKGAHVRAGNASSRRSARSGGHGADGHRRTVAARRSPAEAVAHELHEGRVVLLLFWNPHSYDDQAVHSQVQAAARNLGHRVAVHVAKAGEVGSFGTVTREVSVAQTPTLLIIGRKGTTTTVTGLTDSFSIEQDVREARG